LFVCLFWLGSCIFAQAQLRLYTWTTTHCLLLVEVFSTVYPAGLKSQCSWSLSSWDNTYEPKHLTLQ
jgi:hypothetical protein